MSFYFALNSDIHYGADPKHPDRMFDYKEAAIVRFEKYVDDNPNKVEFMLMAGDLTDHGYSGKQTCFTHEPNDELTPLKKFLRKWDAKLPVYISGGNHDEYNAYPHEVFNLIIKRHGALDYSFKHKGVVFIGCHLYPDNITILKMRLYYYRKYPIIIFFHYALEGLFGDWIPEKSKDEFVSAIKDYDVKAIVVGHRHQTTQLQWRGYTVLMGAGPTIPICKWDNKTQTASISDYL